MKTSRGKRPRNATAKLLGNIPENSSVWVTDPKAQINLITAEYRRRCGQRVTLIDPIGVVNDLIAARARKDRL